MEGGSGQGISLPLYPAGCLPVQIWTRLDRQSWMLVKTLKWGVLWEALPFSKYLLKLRTQAAAILRHMLGTAIF